jgi:hypothetical protein
MAASFKYILHNTNILLLQGIILKENKNIGDAERMFIQVSL